MKNVLSKQDLLNCKYEGPILGWTLDGEKLPDGIETEVGYLYYYMGEGYCIFTKDVDGNIEWHNYITLVDFQNDNKETVTEAKDDTKEVSNKELIVKETAEKKIAKAIEKAKETGIKQEIDRKGYVNDNEEYIEEITYVDSNGEYSTEKINNY